MSDDVACVQCSGGSDWRTTKLKRVDPATGAAEDLEDALEHVKFSSTAWTHDNKVRRPLPCPSACRALFCSFSRCCGAQLWGGSLQGFFYNRYAAPKERNGELGTETDANVNQQLFYHRVGTSQAEDTFLLAQPSDPEWMLSANVTDDGRCWHAPPWLHAQKIGSCGCASAHGRRCDWPRR